MISNRAGREFTMQSLYALEMGQNDLEYFQQDFGETLSGDARAKSFGRKLTQLTLDHLDEIDKMITATSQNWDFNRLAILDKIILRFTIAEILYLKSTPFKVCLTEAIQLANKYSDVESGSFINGVLDTLLKNNFKH